MIASKIKLEPAKFTEKNNIFIGETKPLRSDWKSLGELLWKSINNNANKIAYVNAQTDEQITYAELQNKVVKCSLWLQKKGIKENDVISLCTNNHLDSFVPCIAASYINAIFNPWNEDMDLMTARHVMEMTKPKIIFCTKKSIDIILRVIKEKNLDSTVIVFGDYPGIISFSDMLNAHSNAQIANFRYVENDNIKKTTCIMHSSGTTGLPKGVELSNYSMMLVATNTNIKMQSVALWFSSLYWISGVVMNLISIVQGTIGIICSLFNEEKICELIEKYKVAMVFISTSMLNRFLRGGFVKKYSMSSLQIILTGGAILKLQAQEQVIRTLPNVHVLQAYGMTEFGGMVTMQYPCHKVGSCGTPLQNCQMKIVNPDNGETLGKNETGELCLKMATLMNGYYKNPEETKKIFDEQGWLHTGDIGYIDDNGELYILDRIKDLIKYRGFQISPTEIEILLHQHPAVLEVAIIGVPHPLDDEHPVAFVSIKPGKTVTEKELVDLVANNMMDAYKLRAGVVFLDAFPYTGSGKIAKKELKTMAKKLAVDI